MEVHEGMGAFPEKFDKPSFLNQKQITDKDLHAFTNAVETGKVADADLGEIQDHIKKIQGNPALNAEAQKVCKNFLRVVEEEVFFRAVKQVPEFTFSDTFLKKFFGRTLPQPATQVSKPSQAGSTSPLLKPQAPEKPLIIQGGFINAGNSCYLDSLLEALHACESVKGHLQTLMAQRSTQPTASFQGLIQDAVFEIFKRRDQGKTIAGNTINDLRQDLITCGFAGRSTSANFTQEDASEVCEFLQDIFLMPKFLVKKQVQYNLKAIGLEGSYPAFEARAEQQRTLFVPLQQSQQVTSLEALINQTPVLEEVETKRITPPPEEKKAQIQTTSQTFTPPQPSQTKRIPTVQTFLVGEKKPPKLLRICLNRFTFGTKLTNPVEIPLMLKIPTIEKPNVSRLYDLKSIVLHTEGETPFGGHYITVAPKIENGKRVWDVYDDLNHGEKTAYTIRYPSDETFMKAYGQKVLTNSYILFYEHIAPPPQLSTSTTSSTISF